MFRYLVKIPKECEVQLVDISTGEIIRLSKFDSSNYIRLYDWFGSFIRGLRLGNDLSLTLTCKRK